MPNYRRARVHGGTYFFTLITHRRWALFDNPLACQQLGICLREAQDRWPFQIHAIVLLPNHLHAIWSLPTGDTKYSVRWSWIKKEFTKRWLVASPGEIEISAGREREGRRGIWQPRFWEHTIETEADFERHFDYIHYNPVKHGYVRCPRDWPHSSFHRWVDAGVYPCDWACWEGRSQNLLFPEIERSVGE